MLNTLLNQSPTVTGCTQATIQQSGMQVFAGLRDDPFVTDVGQLMRITSNKQDLFRAFPGSALGALRGRPVRADNTSGVDGFGGFNVEAIAVELPKSVFSGFAGSLGVIAVWGTTGLPVSSTASAVGAIAGHQRVASVVPTTYMQFQRNGQQVFKTVFVPAAQREAFNATTPADDLVNWSSLIPGTLTTKDNDGTGNTIAGRAALLTSLGLTDAGTVAAGAGHGAPLLLPSTFANTNPNLLQAALLPDVLRINLNLIPSGILPGAAASGGNSDPQLALGAFGLQNGRRPADITTDIALQLVRQLADINFPASLGVAGSGPARANALVYGTDRRIPLVLQGTNWIRPDSQVGNVSGNVAPYGGNDQPLLTTFPFLAAPNPLPGETGTVGFPTQQ